MLRRLRQLLRPTRPAAAPPPTGPTVTAPPPSPLEVVLGYHARTKHYPARYARALGYMDWDTQPDPFRRFEGAPQIPLPLTDEPGPRYEPAFVEGQLPAAPATLANLARLVQDSLGLSAWKQAGDARWALRINPSSGNLHPTEGYLVCGPVPGLCDAPGVFHYQPHDHALEHRATLPATAWAALADRLPPGAVLVGLSTIPVRESWKYGERAFRYCHHDVGHAVAAVAVAAAGLGWSTRLLAAADQPALAALLGTICQSGIEAEHPDALLALYPADLPFPVEAWRRAALPAFDLEFTGTPAPLASDHHPWPVIDAVLAATERAGPPPDLTWDPGPRPATGLAVGDSDLRLRAVVHQRRSAVSMDGRTGLTRDAFVQILRKALPGPDQVPFTALPWRPRIDLLLFVHRVADLTPGLYLLSRDPTRLDSLKAALDPEFAWGCPDGIPTDLPLYLLAEGDCRAEAAGASCGQDIASDGCFAVALLAEYAPTLRDLGPEAWRWLHWETGLIGQVLDLEAEASGVRATGIGCFFDDSTHRVIGERDDRFQVLYHFTVGGPVDDPRLQTLPPYAHLDR